MNERLPMLCVPLLVLLGLLVGSSGCASREHMEDEHGRKTREMFRAQHVYSDAAQGAPRGLDSEEAALIHAKYRENLGGKRAGKAQAKDSPAKVLILQDPVDAPQ